MWSKALAAVALLQAMAHATPTWPAQIDEIEDLLMLQTGYRARGFAAPITPCSRQAVPGFNLAAGFIRTAFHDMAEHNFAAGTGGLDASVGYELGPPFDTHNAGPAINGSMNYYANFFNSKASMADLIALGLVSAVRSCSGPIVALRAGRIDATHSGTNALPDAGDNAAVLTGRFNKMGFSPAQMIQLVACGHTTGGVHITQNPNITTNSQRALAAKDNTLNFDTTPDRFDNAVATEYVSGTTRNPLVNGNPKLASDKVVFQVDGNNMIRQLASSNNAFLGVCQSILQTMIERVPKGVKLSDVITPYEAKPGQLNLQVVDNGASMLFSGEVRIRTTSEGVKSVQLVYKDNKGLGGATPISTHFAGTASNSFPESFAFYGFAQKITSISSFNIFVTYTSGRTATYSNNGQGFQVNDNGFVQVSSSSYSGSQMKVVVAVRSGLLQSVPQLTLSVKTPMSFNSIPKINKLSSSSPSRICGDNKFTYYSATFSNIAPAQAASAKLDVSLGGVVVDAFRSVNGWASTATAPTCGSNTTSTTSATSTKTSSSSSLSSTVSTSKSSSTSSVSASTTSSGSSSLTSTASSSSTLSSTLSTSITSGTSVSGTLTSSTGTSSGSSTSATSTSTSTESISGSSTTETSSTSSWLTTTSSDESASSTTVDESSTTSYWTTTATTTTSDDYNPPSWTEWDPVPVGPGPTAPTYNDPAGPTGTDWSGITTGAYDGHGSYPTGAAGSVYPIADHAADILSSIYNDQANEPAPSGGTDGGNKNIAGLDLHVTVEIIHITITAPTGYVGTGWEGYDAVAPTATATTWEGLDSVAPTSTATTWQGWTDAPAPIGTPVLGTTAWSGVAVSPSATKSAFIGKFTGAANALVARSEAVVLGAAAVAGAVAVLF